MALHPVPGDRAQPLGEHLALQRRHESVGQSLADITPPNSTAVTPRISPTGSPRSAPYMPIEAPTISAASPQVPVQAGDNNAMTVRQDTEMLMGQGYALVRQVRQLTPTPDQQELQQSVNQLMQQLQQQIHENGFIRDQAAAALHEQAARCEAVIANQSASFRDTAQNFEQAARDEKEVALAQARNASHVQAAAITGESQRLRSRLEKANADHASYRSKAIATEHLMEEQLSQSRSTAENWRKHTEEYQSKATVGNEELQRLVKQVEDLQAGLQIAQAQLLAKDDDAKASDQHGVENMRLQLTNQKLASELQMAIIWNKENRRTAQSTSSNYELSQRSGPSV
jgi:hypothetical protein